jgi:hypothetical protein
MKSDKNLFSVQLGSNKLRTGIVFDYMNRNRHGISINEHSGLVVNTPTSYPICPAFKTRSRATLTEIFRGSLQSLQADAGVIP